MDDGTRCPRCGEVLNDWEMKQGWHTRRVHDPKGSYTIRCVIEEDECKTEE